jgi:hypothetical protein
MAKEPRFTVAMYNGIEREGAPEVAATVDYFRKGIPGFRREMTHDPQKCEETIAAIWQKLAPAMVQHDITPPPEATAYLKGVKTGG